MLSPNPNQQSQQQQPIKSPRDVEDWVESTSNQPTPTTWEQRLEGDGMPDGLITDWDTQGVANWINSLGFGKYQDALLENNIDGSVLISLGHDELRELGITSIGHRLSILKYVYNIKIAHGVPMDPDDYVPVSADENEINKAATQEDIQRLIQIVKKRDARIIEAEKQIQTLYDAISRLRGEFLPVWTIIKNNNQQLPPLSGDPRNVGNSGGKGETETPGVASGQEQVSDPAPHPSSLLQPTPGSGRGLSRKFSMKKLILGTPKNASPTYPPTMHEYPQQESSIPQNGIQQNAPVLSAPTTDLHGHPSPTSPGGATIHHPPYNPHNSIISSRRPQQTPRTPHYPDDTPNSGGLNPPSSGSGGEPDIFKSFRVSMEDPCRKVLPAALKRYNIQADWRQYALYIVHGDQERCLGLEEKPLILFKQLDREGRKPMFMLRRNVGGGGPDTGSGIQVPGGVL